MNNTTFEKSEIEKLKLVVLSYITEELWAECIALNDPELRIMSDMLSEAIIMRLSCNVAVRHEAEYEFEWYKSWWHELMSRILPKFWLHKFPCKKEVKKKIKSVSTYPSFNFGGVDHKSMVVFLDG